MSFVDRAADHYDDPPLIDLEVDTTVVPVLIAQTDTGTSGSIIGLVLPLVLLVGIFWVLFILPQRRRMKALDQMRSSLDVGDEIRTVGGIIGHIRRIDDDVVTVDVGGGTELRFAARAIADKITPPDPVD